MMTVVVIKNPRNSCKSRTGDRFNIMSVAEGNAYITGCDNKVILDIDKFCFSCDILKLV